MADDDAAPRVRRATLDDLAVVVEILTASHEHYVWEEWLIPERGRRDILERIMNLTTRLVAIPHGEVWVAGDASAAVWLPPGAGEPTGSDAKELETNFAAVFGDRLEALHEVDAALREMCPTDRHWTLGTMGTLPHRQRHGLGAQALAPMLERLDDAGECASLETSTEENVGFYERFGFHAVAFDDDLPHGAPPVWLMWRDPR